jgi:hypothetical protein
MPHKIEWFIPGRVVFGDFEGRVTLDELAEVDEKVNNYVAEGDPLVHYIVEGLKITYLPNNIPKLAKTITYIHNKDLGWIIYITQNKLMRFLASTVSQLAQARFRTFENLEEGIQFLLETDQSLNRDDIRLNLEKRLE